MPTAMYDDTLAARIRPLLPADPPAIEIAMFGGLAFMVHGNMACGVMGDDLLVRTGPDRYADAIMEPYARPMEFTGRAMKSMLIVDRAGLDDAGLERWVGLGLEVAASLPSKELGSKRRPRPRTAKG
jgi:hypothetical protein